MSNVLKLRTLIAEIICIVQKYFTHEIFRNIVGEAYFIMDITNVSKIYY